MVTCMGELINIENYLKCKKKKKIEIEKKKKKIKFKITSPSFIQLPFIKLLLIKRYNSSYRHSWMKKIINKTKSHHCFFNTLKDKKLQIDWHAIRCILPRTIEVYRCLRNCQLKEISKAYVIGLECHKI